MLTEFVIACPPLVNATVGLLILMSLTKVNVIISPTLALVLARALLVDIAVLLITGGIA